MGPTSSNAGELDTESNASHISAATELNASCISGA